MLPGQKKAIRELLAEVEQSGEVNRFARGVVTAGRSKSDAGTRAHSKALRAKFLERLVSFRVSFGSAGRPRTAFGHSLRSEMSS